MYLRGDQPSVCPALLCNPRRSQVAPKADFIIAYFVVNRTAITVLRLNDEFQKVIWQIQQQIRIPTFWFSLPTITPSGRNAKHICGMRGLNVA